MKTHGLRTTSLRLRLGAAFGSMVLLLIACVAFGVLRLGSLNTSMQSLLEREVRASVSSAQLEGHSQAMAKALGLAVMADNVDEIQALLKQVDKLVVDNAETKKFLETALDSDSGRASLKLVVDVEPAYMAAVGKVVATIKSGDSDAARLQLNSKSLHDASAAYLGALAKLGIAQQEAMNVAKADAERAYASGRNMLLVAAGIAVALALMLGLMITRSLVRQLGGEPADAVTVATRIASGDLSMDIKLVQGDTSSLMACMKTMQAAVQALVNDAAKLSEAAVAGKLATRADAAKHQGDFNRVVAGVNATLDAVIGPLNVAAGYVDQISRGAIPAKITDSYNGDFNALKNNLNVCIDAVNALVADANMLSKAAVEGRLETRADASRHQGDFRKVVEGVNATLDAVIGPLNEGMRVLGALSKGDLTEKITDNYQGTFGKLKEDANLTVDKLTEIVTQIKDSTESINVASKEIASGNSDLSSRTEEQASSLEETASSMEELTSTVKQNAENARQANQLAAGASEVAVKGGNVVGQVVSTMSSINESSKKIVDIISVIDGIAFQTNILALNAAVEAARAGEQGRGFAVVATEVRTLAQRSAAAAKEIKELIGDSVEKVGAGTRLVDEAGITMQEIVASVKRVTDIMSEITAASQAQSAGIEQVNKSITQMDEVTQQNAALVEQAAAAAESMEEQAGNLAQAVSIFKLSRQIAPATAGRPGVATLAVLPQPRSQATVTKLPPAKIRAAKAAGAGEEWSEF